MPVRSPLVSVCVPSWNSEPFIQACIESVLQQSFEDFELIIVDDHSTDGTFEILRGFQDSRIRLFRNKCNIGLVKNWNLSVSLASGTYVKILPGDDYLYRDCLAEQVEAFRNSHTANISLVGAPRDIVDWKGQRIMGRPFLPRPGLTSGERAISLCVRSGTNIIGEPGAVLLRRDLFELCGGVREGLVYAVDVDLWLRVLQYGNLFMNSQVLSAFRVSETSTSYSLAWRQALQMNRFYSSLESDPAFSISKFDVLSGRFLTILNTLGRVMMYRSLNRFMRPPAARSTSSPDINDVVHY